MIDPLGFSMHRPPVALTVIVGLPVDCDPRPGLLLNIHLGLANLQKEAQAGDEKKSQ